MNSIHLSQQNKIKMLIQFKKLKFSPQANYVSKTIKNFSEHNFQKFNKDNKKKKRIRITKPLLNLSVKQQQKTRIQEYQSINQHNLSISPFMSQKQNSQNIVNKTGSLPNIDLKQFNPQISQNQLFVSPDQTNLDHLKSINAHNFYQFHPEHKNITRMSRIILIDWLMQLSQQLQFTKQIFYNAVYYMDKYIETSFIQKKSLQIMGLSALSIAAKLQMNNAPNARMLVLSMDGGCTVQQLVNCEQKILRVLAFRLNPSTLFHFYRTVLKILEQYIKIQHKDWPNLLSKQYFYVYKQSCNILDLILMQYQSIYYDKDKIAVSLIYLILKKHKKQNLDQFLVDFQLFCINKLNIKFIELQLSIKLISRFLGINKIQNNSRASLKKNICHSYLLSLQGYSNQLKEWIIHN